MERGRSCFRNANAGGIRTRECTAVGASFPNVTTRCRTGAGSLERGRELSKVGRARGAVTQCPSVRRLERTAPPGWCRMLPQRPWSDSAAHSTKSADCRYATSENGTTVVSWRSWGDDQVDRCRCPYEVGTHLYAGGLRDGPRSDRVEVGGIGARRVRRDGERGIGRQRKV